MSEDVEGKKERRAETVRLVLSSRERAPRSPRMERALKRLIWRYTRTTQDKEGFVDAQE
jgi:hypothetical protein